MIRSSVFAPVTVDCEHGHPNYAIDTVRLDVDDPRILWVHCPAPDCGWFTVPMPTEYIDRLVDDEFGTRDRHFNQGGDDV
ncbi:MAG: hypothetical protein GY851_09350 [bacterium]|nr:hypothetical protein [bacterium]